MSEVFTVAGMIFEGVGLLVAGYGLRKTWHDYAEGERFRDYYMARASAVASWAWSMVRRLLGRRPTKIVGAGAAMGVGTAMNARGRVTWGALPGTTELAFAELHRRTLDLQKTHADATERLDDAVAELRTAASETRARLDEDVSRLQSLNRTVAIGGVRDEATGLFLVAFGLFLQVIGTVL